MRSFQMKSSAEILSELFEGKYEFDPDWASPPGETIADAIEEKNWKQKELASRLGISDKHVNQLIKGKVTLTPDMARRLATVLGSTEGFWLRREALYREQLLNVAFLKECEKYTDWLDNFPLAELKELNILSDYRTGKSVKPRFAKELLRFFAVNAPKEWEENYAQLQESFQRVKGDTNDVGVASVWLRLGEIIAEEWEKQLYKAGESRRFNKSVFKRELRHLRQYTVLDPQNFQEVMQEGCLRSGVFLLFVPAIRKVRISGVARWASNRRPIIQLPPHKRSNDEFWFSFYTQAAHLLLHSEDKNHMHFDYDQDVDSKMEMEQEARDWAQQLLIPKEHDSELRGLNSVPAVRDFASEIGIHPGIVVGRLQEEGYIPHSAMNHLKLKVEIK